MYGIGMSAGSSSTAPRVGIVLNGGVRQQDDKPDTFASLPINNQDDDNDDESSIGGHYKYTRLLNCSPSIYTNNDSTNNNHEDDETVFGVGMMSKSESDQKIPDMVRVDQASRAYNKSGGVVSNNQRDLFCQDILLEVYKNNKDMLKSNLPGSQYQMDRLSVNNRSVPNAIINQQQDNLNLSFNTLNLDDHHHHQMGRAAASQNSSMNNDNDSLEISYDHVKYINVFSLLCCWCFPITGLISVIYARLTHKYFKMRDLTRAKRYLEKSEWMLILTFFFGFTLIALGFCFLEYYWFKSTSDLTAAHTRGAGAANNRRLPYYHFAKHLQ